MNAEPISEMKEASEGEGHDSEDPDETLMENRQSNMQMDDDDDYDEEEANDQFDPKLDQKIQQIKNNYN